LPEVWKESINVRNYKKDDKTDCSNYSRISLLPTTYKILSNILLSRLIPYAEEIIGSGVDFDATGQLLTINSTFVSYLRKNGEYNKAVHQLFIDFKKAYDSVRREVLCNIVIEFGVHIKLVRLIKVSE
jgi:hypothetical protein